MLFQGDLGQIEALLVLGIQGIEALPFPDLLPQPLVYIHARQRLVRRSQNPGNLVNRLIIHLGDPAIIWSVEPPTLGGQRQVLGVNL